MKMEKTSREVLVTLSASDQKAFGLCYDTMSYSDPKTRRFCEHLAVLVCLREGVPDTGSMTVRAAENASGELLLYFSCTGEALREHYSQVVVFPDLDSFLDCRRIFLSDPALCAEVYRYAGQYFLWYEFDTTPDRFDALTSDLLEYGSFSLLDRTFLAEHAHPLPAAAAYLLN